MKLKLMTAAAFLAMPVELSAQAPVDQVKSAAGPVQVEAVAKGLEHPWSLAFLPSGEMLVTERKGNLYRVSKEGDLSEPIANTPKVWAQGQGGLLDIALDPEFASNRMIYMCYAEPGGGGASTAAARGVLNKDASAIEDLQVIFQQMPKVEGDKHFGCRLAFSPDGKLFITLGERYKFDPAQDLSSHLGTVIRINKDGSVPDDNPFVGKQNAKPEIWSYGHRNIEAAAIHPETGQLWITEMGPKGGDELNLPQAGRNYGWPLVSWGIHYSGEEIPDPTTRPELAQSIYHWNPVISPSGMIFYTGDMFPDWQGNVLIGALSGKAIVRLTVDGQKVQDEERLDMKARIRDVQQGPDGAIYALTDQPQGEILRLTPGNRQARN